MNQAPRKRLAGKLPTPPTRRQLLLGGTNFVEERSNGMSVIALVTTLAGWFWIFMFLTLNPPFIQKLCEAAFDDRKNGIPMVAIAAPLFLSTAFIILFTKQQGTGIPVPRLLYTLPHRIPARVHVLAQCARVCLRIPRFQVDFDLMGLGFVVLPATVYLLRSLFRKWSAFDHEDWPLLAKSFANSFGFASILVMSIFLLVPVAKHSTLLSLLGWNPANAIRLHVWAGYFVVVTAAIHSIVYLHRYLIVQRGDSFVYSTGFISFLLMILIAVTSRYRVRRSNYSLFYRVHVAAGPILFSVLILHYRKRGLLYVTSAMLYYLAASVPVWMENWITRRRGGTQIYAVTSIPCPSTNDCTALVVTATDLAMIRYRCGQYIKALAPGLSSVAHPFTVNTVPGQHNKLVIIFRQTGEFTRKLAASMAKKREGFEGPMVILDGFYGTQDRVRQVLQHDVVVFLAGGIGVTPFLSLLNEVHTLLSSQQGTAFTKRVILHWLCREESLHQYIKTMFFDPLLSSAGVAGFSIELIVHLTRQQSIDEEEAWSKITQQTPDEGASGSEGPMLVRHGVPFSASKFAPGTGQSYRSNFLPFFTNAAISGAGIYVSWKLEKWSRSCPSILFLSTPILVGLSVTVALLVNLLRFNMNFWGTTKYESVVKTRGWDYTVGDSLETRSTSDDDSSGITGSEHGGVVSTDVRIGRPDIPELLGCLDRGIRPGLFICGPESIKNSARATIRGRGSGAARCALYEEHFHL